MSQLKVRILLLDGDPVRARTLRQMLCETEGLSPEITWLERHAFDRKHLEDSRADVVLMALPAADQEDHEPLASVRAHAHTVPIIILAASGQEMLARRAVSQGARDYLVRGRWNAHSLARTIQSVIERHRTGLDLGRQPDRAGKGKVLGFAGAKGGVGATTLALNMAAVLSRDHSRVIAAELTPGCGGFALHLGNPRGGDLGNLLHFEAGGISEQALAACLAPLPFGVHVLFGARPGASGFPRNEQVEAVVQAAARQADYLILDLPPFSSPVCQAAARGCDLVVLVVDREPACVAAAREGADLLRTWGGTESGPGVVIVNRTPLASLGSAAEIRSAVKCEILGVVPHDMVLASVWHRQAPLVVSHPDSATSESLAEIGKRLANMGQTADALVL
ncbi:MAG: hypothetical protein JJE04_22975 [Acidobacteriia bacterium]|nr:hypothetical protein [Terriglobia bacterium]